MEHKITCYLFYMGLIAAVLATVLTALVFRSSFEEQWVDELSRTAGLLAKSYTPLEDKEDILRYADDSLRLTLVDADGRVLCGRRRRCRQFGKPPPTGRRSCRRLRRGPEARCAARIPCRSVCIITPSAWRMDGRRAVGDSSGNNLLHLFGQAYSFAALGVCALLVLAVIFAIVLTKKLLRPIRRLTEEMDDLPPDPEGEYKELAPFVREIRSRRQRIQSQMRTIEEEKNKLFRHPARYGGGANFA